MKYDARRHEYHSAWFYYDSSWDDKIMTLVNEECLYYSND